MAQTFVREFVATGSDLSDRIQRQFEKLGANSTLAKVLEAMPQPVAVLDEDRQVIAMNAHLMQSCSGANLDEILGKRPGELLCCDRLAEPGQRCGTTEACSVCGALQAIRTSRSEGRAVTRTCQLTVSGTGEALDLRVTASPLRIEGRPLTVLSILDMADENRRRVLEHTFFHDVLNAAGGALGIARELVDAEDMSDVEELAPLLVLVTGQMIEEIRAQRDLLDAEHGELEVRHEEFGAVQFLMEIVDTYAQHPVCEDRILELAADSQDRLLQSSKTLLHRVLGNMVKNALEATGRGGLVRVGCSVDRNEFCFWVNNPEVMPRAVQLQVFNRSFSTKGTGRGIGTYSIRLLGERYLGGRVSFDSKQGIGTTFRIHLPVASSDTRR